MRRRSAHACDARGGTLSETPARPHPALPRCDALPEAMNYFHLLQLASPEATVTIAALVVLGLHVAWPRGRWLSPWVAGLGLNGAGAKILALPRIDHWG